MVRLLALGSFVYQSATAIILIFALSHILPPAEYTAFSLALASSQLLCVLMFEWLQLAGVRFLAAARGEEVLRLRSSLAAAALLSAVALILVGGTISFTRTLAPMVVGLGLGLAVLQGFTDLYFMMIRVSDRLGIAALLLILRASLLLAGAIVAAHGYGTTAATLSGMVCGHAAALAIGWFGHRMPLKRVPHGALLADWADFSRYGMLAAGASVIHLSVPVAMRFIVIGGLAAAGPAVTAGFSIAVDLLQRPFAVLVAAIHVMNYPDVVVEFERGTDHEARQATARLFDFILCATIIMLGGLIGFLPDAGRLFVPPDVLVSFLSAGPAAAIFYFLHTHLQSTFAVIPHLRKSAMRLVVVAGCQLITVTLFSTTAAVMGFSPAAVIASAAIATAMIILLAGGFTVRYGAFPNWSLVSVAAMAAIAIGGFSAAPSESVVWLVGKVVVSAALVALIAWRGDFLASAKRKAPVSG
jgi:O-antigen/teichoic acid export membrane protein